MLFLRSLNAFFYFNQNLLLQRWRHFFHFRSNKFVIENSMCCIRDFALLFSCCFLWLFQQIYSWCYYVWLIALNFRFFNCRRIYRFFAYNEIMRDFDFLFLFNLKSFEIRFIIILMMLIKYLIFMLTIEFYNKFSKWIFIK